MITLPLLRAGANAEGCSDRAKFAEIIPAMCGLLASCRVGKRTQRSRLTPANERAAIVTLLAKAFNVRQDRAISGSVLISEGEGEKPLLSVVKKKAVAEDIPAEQNMKTLLAKLAFNDRQRLKDQPCSWRMLVDNAQEHIVLIRRMRRSSSGRGLDQSGPSRDKTKCLNN